MYAMAPGGWVSRRENNALPASRTEAESARTAGDWAAWITPVIP